MKASEIRIGNIALCNSHDTTWSEFVFKDWEDIGLCERNPEIFKPIPFTEEWLPKLGFEKQGNVIKLSTDKGIRFSFINSKMNVACDALGTWFSPPGEFIHDLQNLYFSLTGEELVLNKTT